MKNPSLKRLRNNLRAVIIEAVKNMGTIENDKEYHLFSDRLDSSILYCPSYHAIDKDMVLIHP